MKQTNITNGFIAILIATALVATASRSPAADEQTGSSVTLSADLASAYVFRGATLNDGPVLQPGVEVAGLPVTFGVWGNMDLSDYNAALNAGEFSELDLSASYELPLKSELISSTVGYTEYTYNSSGAAADREASIGTALNCLLSPSLTLFYGLDGAIRQDIYLEAALEHSIQLPADMTTSMNATVAYLDDNETTDALGNTVGGERGMSNFTLGSSLTYKIVTASVTYVESLDDKVLPDVNHGGPYDIQVYGSIGAKYSF